LLALFGIFSSFRAVFTKKFILIDRWGKSLIHILSHNVTQISQKKSDIFFTTFLQFAQAVSAAACHTGGPCLIPVTIQTLVIDQNRNFQLRTNQNIWQRCCYGIFVFGQIFGAYCRLLLKSSI
jgi:hypothetical protein